MEWWSLLRAGINPAPTERVGEPPVGAGFTPARRGCQNLQIVHLSVLQSY